MLNLIIFKIFKINYIKINKFRKCNAIPSASYVKKIMFSFDSNKSPCPDGLPQKTSEILLNVPCGSCAAFLSNWAYG